MREILFRGKRVDNGEWVYGAYLPKSQMVCTEETKPNSTEYRDYFICPETLGQYTGLTDKNGKKIFEGDIVEITSRYYGRKEKHSYQIKWHDSTASWNAFGLEFIQRVPLCNNEQPYYKIIGNIHDNPELLKGGEG